MTTDLRQAIVDWTKSLPAWQRDLARRLATNDGLVEEELEEVLSLILDENRLQPIALQSDDLPSGDGADTPVELRELGDMQNINCLAGGQRLRFVSGLNVVYGDTGAWQEWPYPAVAPGLPGRRTRRGAARRV